jgi:hypothetical protein
VAVVKKGGAIQPLSSGVMRYQLKKHYPSVVSGGCGRRWELEEIRKSVPSSFKLRHT